MKDLYTYIFTKAYFFCINIFKEKEFPQYFASGVITLAFVTNVIIVIELVEYIILPTKINTYGEYHGYFALACFVIILLYVNVKKRYEGILSRFDNIPIEKRKKLKAYSIIYLLVLFIGFFLLGALLRNYNI